MEVYKSYRKKNKKTIYKIVLVYVLCILIRLFTYNFVGEVVAINPQYKEHFLSFADNEKSHTQKVLVTKGILLHRLSNEGFSFKTKKIQKGDMVLVPLKYGKENTQPFLQYLRKISSILTLGIIENKSRRVFRKVVGVEGDVIVYNAKRILSINGPAARFFKNEDFPLLDEPKEVELHTGQLFLIGKSPYTVDDKILGPSKITDINAKAFLLLGPQWGLISSQSKK